jgi:hypothetical protein
LDGGVVCVLLVDLLLIGVTVAAAVLSQPALALIVGAGSVDIARQLARSLL